MVRVERGRPSQGAREVRGGASRRGRRRDERRGAGRGRADGARRRRSHEGACGGRARAGEAVGAGEGGRPRERGAQARAFQLGRGRQEGDLEEVREGPRRNLRREPAGRVRLLRLAARRRRGGRGVRGGGGGRRFRPLRQRREVPHHPPRRGLPHHPRRRRDRRGGFARADAHGRLEERPPLRRQLGDGRRQGQAGRRPPLRGRLSPQGLSRRRPFRRLQRLQERGGDAGGDLGEVSRGAAVGGGQEPLLRDCVLLVDRGQRRLRRDGRARRRLRQLPPRVSRRQRPARRRRGEAHERLLRRPQEAVAPLGPRDEGRDGVRHVAVDMLSARLGAQPLLRLDTQLRRRDHPLDDPREAPLLAAHPQVDGGHEEDAGTPAEDEGDPGEVQGQPAAHAAGDLGALPRREGESGELVPADADPDPRLHRALQRAQVRGRAPLRAVPLDRRPLRAGRAVCELVPVRRTQPSADPDGGLDRPPERVHAVYRRQEPAADDDGVHAADDARDVLLVPVGAFALLVPLQPLLDRADVDHPPPDGEGARGCRARGGGDRPAVDAADAPPRRRRACGCARVARAGRLRPHLRAPGVARRDRRRAPAGLLRAWRRARAAGGEGRRDAPRQVRRRAGLAAAPRGV